MHPVKKELIIECGGGRRWDLWSCTAETEPSTVPPAAAREAADMIRLGPTPEDALQGMVVAGRLAQSQEAWVRERVLFSGAVPYLVAFLACDAWPALRRGAWVALAPATSDTSATTHPLTVQATVCLLGLLQSSGWGDAAAAVHQIALEALIRYAVADAAHRDAMVEARALHTLTQMIAGQGGRRSHPAWVRENCLRLLAAMLRTEPTPSAAAVRDVVPLLVELARAGHGRLWRRAMACLTLLADDGDDARVSALLAAGLLPCLEARLRGAAGGGDAGDDGAEMEAAQRLLANVVAAGEAHGRVVLRRESGVLQALADALGGEFGPHEGHDVVSIAAGLLSLGGGAAAREALAATGLLSAMLVSCRRLGPWTQVKMLREVIAEYARRGGAADAQCLAGRLGLVPALAPVLHSLPADAAYVASSVVDVFALVLAKLPARRHHHSDPPQATRRAVLQQMREAGAFSALHRILNDASAGAQQDDIAKITVFLKKYDKKPSKTRRLLQWMRGSHAH